MIQIIGINKKLYEEETKGKYVISTFDNFQALDDFELCIIDLNKSDIWKYNAATKTGLNCAKDLGNLKEAISRSEKCKILIVLPQNLTYNYYSANDGVTFMRKESLKNMRDALFSIITENVIDISYFRICSEKTITKVEDCNINADFYFSDFALAHYEILSQSNNSGKPTTIKKETIILTTLDFLGINNNIEELNAFINEFCIDSNEQEEIPEWIEDINFFDDEVLIAAKEKNIEKIEDLKNENEVLEKKLRKNLEYKSILYSTGDKLVKIVLEILDELLDNDSSTFIDERREDFLIKKDDITFIGEIKGISQSVANKNVAQLDNHVQEYMDKLELEKKEENVKGVLIINHQRKIPLDKRQKIHENQLRIATRNGALIIETQTLLDLYDKFKKQEITKEECKRLFTEEVGIL